MEHIEVDNKFNHIAIPHQKLENNFLSPEVRPSSQKDHFSS